MGRKVVVIGGGALGAATAAFVADRLGKKVEIVVLERDLSYAHASSALSASSIRQQFSTRINIELSNATYRFFERLERREGTDAIGLMQCGYLFLATETQSDGLRARAALARSVGVDVREYSSEQLSDTFPWLHVEDIACATRALNGEGWFDGYRLLQAYRQLASEAGVNFERGDAQSLECDDCRVTGVRLRDGRRIQANQIIVAAGAWSGPLLEGVGIVCPIRPRRRTVLVMSAPRQIPDMPILVDTTGVYVRRDGAYYLTVVSPPPEGDEDGLPLDPDLNLFDDLIWPALAARSRAFEALRVERAWAGYYDYNTFDQNGLVGATQMQNLYIAAGFSGHGLMHSAGVARGISELLGSGRYETLDLSPLSPNRVSEGRRITESAIY